MATGHTSEVIQQLRTTVLRDGAGLTDAQLLERFVDRRDEAAFEAIVRRHGSLVMGVCRRLLRDRHDAEDAFQATFLVLVRKAAAIATRTLLANWLYGVAYNTALKAKAAVVRRRVRERQGTEMPELDAAAPEPGRDLQELLDRELSGLPDKYRLPIVLCELEGKAHKDAAQKLGWPVGTLSGRLSRARTMLAKRLARHGLTLSAGSLAALLSQQAEASVPAAVVCSTVKAASVFAAGQAAATGVVSAEVIALTEGVLKAMFLTKLKTMAALLGTLVVLSAAALTGGVLADGRQDGNGGAGPEKPAVKAEDKPKEAAKGLTAKIVVKSKLFLRFEELAVELVLTNEGEQSLRICKLVGGKTRNNFEESDTTLRPEAYPFEQETAKNIVTLKQGESVALPIPTLKRVRGMDGKYKVSAAYEVGEAFAKEHNTWFGRVEAKPLVVQVGEVKPAEDKIRPGDRLFIQATNTLPNADIKDFYLVEPSGKVALGPDYGRVVVGDMTLEKAEAAIQQHLAKFVKNPRVSVTRPVPSPGTKAADRELERRVEELEKEVQALRAALEELRKKSRD